MKDNDQASVIADEAEHQSDAVGLFVLTHPIYLYMQKHFFFLDSIIAMLNLCFSGSLLSVSVVLSYLLFCSFACTFVFGIVVCRKNGF